MPSYELFDLTERASPRDFDPLMLGLCNSDARELPGSRPVNGAVAERLLEFRQIFECFGDAKALLRPARLVAKKTLDVFHEGSKSEMDMGSAPKAGNQGTAFFPIETRPALGEA
jgi:hypothetical protein